MIWFHLAVAIIFIIIGSRLGGVGVGLAGGAGCIVHLTEVMLRKNPTTSIILRRYQRSSSPCCVALDIPHILCCLSSSKWRRSTRSDRRGRCP